MLKHTRAFSLILSLLFIFSCAWNVNASTPISEAEEEDPAFASRNVIIHDKIEDDGVSLTLIHSLSVTNVTGLLYNSTKTITRNSLPSGAVRIYAAGKLTMSGVSYGASNFIRTGLCYYDADSQYFIPAYYSNVDSGVSFSINLCAVSSLSSYRTYYPYIKNLEPSYGNVSGAVGFYYSVT